MTSDWIENFERDRTRARYQAQSVLTGEVFRDGTTICPPLTLDQAADVLQWSRNYRVM